MFISHTQDTEDYVKTILKSGLMEKGYRVQTPVDYVVGHTTDDIMKAFTTSRYIIILFSASYDHHCLELQYAYNKVSKTHCNCLIPMKCGGVIPKKLQCITYADYDNDEVITRVEQTIGMFNRYTVVPPLSGNRLSELSVIQTCGVIVLLEYFA